MKRFQFRLEGIYKLRKEAERECELEVQKLRFTEGQILNRLQEISNDEFKWSEVYNDIGQKDTPLTTDQEGGVVHVTEWRMMVENYLISLEAERRSWQNQLSKMKIEIQKAMAKLQEAYRARKQVEHLKELQHRQYREEMERQQQKESEEMSVIRFTYLKQQEEGYDA